MKRPQFMVALVVATCLLADRSFNFPFTELPGRLAPGNGWDVVGFTVGAHPIRSEKAKYMTRLVLAHKPYESVSVTVAYLKEGSTPNQFLGEQAYGVQLAMPWDLSDKGTTSFGGSKIGDGSRAGINGNYAGIAAWQSDIILSVFATSNRPTPEFSSHIALDKLAETLLQNAATVEKRAPKKEGLCLRLIATPLPSPSPAFHEERADCEILSLMRRGDNDAARYAVRWTEGNTEITATMNLCKSAEVAGYLFKKEGSESAEDGTQTTHDRADFQRVIAKTGRLEMRLERRGKATVDLVKLSHALQKQLGQIAF